MPIHHFLFLTTLTRERISKRRLLTMKILLETSGFSRKSYFTHDPRSRIPVDFWIVKITETVEAVCAIVCVTANRLLESEWRKKWLIHGQSLWWFWNRWIMGNDGTVFGSLGSRSEQPCWTASVCLWAMQLRETERHESMDEMYNVNWYFWFINS